MIDTFARCYSGDENSTEDMSLAVREIDMLRAKFPEVAVLLVHHTNKKGKDYRGSSALHGALDSMTLVKKSGDTVAVVNDKQKDAARHGPMSFTLKQVELVAADEDGDPIASCVLASGEVHREGWLDHLTDSQKQSLVALYECGKGAVPSAKWQEKALKSGLKQSTFDKTKSKLEELALIEGEGKGRSRRWRLTDWGSLCVKLDAGSHHAVGDAATKRRPIETPSKPDVIPSKGGASPSETVVHESVDEVPASDSGDEEDPGPWDLPDDFPTDGPWSSGDDSDEADVPQVSLSGEENQS